MKPYVQFCESHIVDCGDLIDWAARDVARVMCGPKNEALRALELLRGAERWWVSPAKIGQRSPQGVETPFTAARRKLEAGLHARS